MRIAALAVAGVMGCGFSTTIGVVDGDAPTGEGAYGACMTWTFIPTDFHPCALVPPQTTPVLTTGTYVIDSDTGVIDGAGVSNVQLAYTVTNGVGVVSVGTWTIPTGVTVRGEGSLALVIAAWGSLTIAGRVDVSSVVGGTPGAGANPSTCGTGIGAIGSANSGGDGGGGGGGFAANGGRGGNGSGVTNSGGTAGVMRALPATIQGGCRGGDAPAGDGGNPGDGGSGGGAIALVARDSLSVAGLVHAGGAGGTGGSTSRTGGGGGGSGGMIRLETNSLSFTPTSILAANGGQGGGGCNGGTAGNGVDGTPGATEPAAGNSESGGTDGGGGGWRDRPTGNTASSASDGGGGGGGGVGYIVYKGHTSTNNLPNVSSPAAQTY